MINFTNRRKERKRQKVGANILQCGLWRY